MRALPVGRRALLVETSDQETALALYAEIERRRQTGWQKSLVDVIPAARTVMLDGLDDPAAVASELETWRPSSLGALTGPLA